MGQLQLLCADPGAGELCGFCDLNRAQPDRGGDAPVGAECAGVSSGADAVADDCRPGGERRDRGAASGGGTAVPAEGKRVALALWFVGETKAARVGAMDGLSNLTPTQKRSERKRRYKHLRQSSLEVAGAVPRQIAYLDVLQV